MNASTIGALILVTLTVAGCGQDAATPPAGIATPAPQAPVEGPGVASRDFGNHVVHFNAISTDQLTPEVAKTYNIVRSRNRALLNVSILKKVEGTTGTAVTGKIEALVANDTGQVKDSNLREIREGDAIYYIADFAVSNAETLVFTLKVTPETETSALDVKFTRTFYSE